MTRPTGEMDPGRAGVATYRIRVVGVLGEEWSRRAQGMAVSVHHAEQQGTFTELFGELPDEAALMGVLDALYSHGARLLSVERIDENGVNVVRLEESQVKTDQPSKGATE